MLGVGINLWGNTKDPYSLSLDLQFATDKTLTARKGPTPVLTRTQVSPTGSTYVGSDGLIKYAGNNEPRFDHDPLTPFACRGLLIEESRTNLLTGSQTFATSGGSPNNWIDTNITRDGTLRTSPDGTSNALRITASAANGTVISSQIAGLSALRAFSIFLRRVTGTGNIQYTLDNGTTWATQTITTSWVRYTFAATTGTQRVGVRIVTAADAIEIWGAQIEAGAFATSYIPTTTGSVIRSADVCSITSADFTGMYNQTEGSVLVEASTVISGRRDLVSIDTNGYSENITLFTGSNAAQISVIDNSFSQVNMSIGSPISSNIAFKLACAYKLNDFTATKNGVPPQTDNTGTLPTPNQLKIGYEKGQYFLCGHVASLRYYKKRLPNDKLQSLTA